MGDCKLSMIYRAYFSTIYNPYKKRVFSNVFLATVYV